MRLEKDYYDIYMKFNFLVEPWNKEFLLRQLRNIGLFRAVVTDNDVQNIHWCYEQKPQKRFYHNGIHGAFVGQEEAPVKLLSKLSSRFLPHKAKSILSLAGLFHDTAYKHIDELDEGENTSRAWPTVLKKKIIEFVKYTKSKKDGKAIYHTWLEEREREDPVTKMVAHVFGVGDNGIIHNQGGNEFDSAMAAAKFLETKGALPGDILAVVVAIALTIPFKEAATRDENGNIIGDGHMQVMVDRLKSLKIKFKNSNIPYQPDYEVINDVMLMGVHLSNRDISPFVRPDNFPGVIAGGRDIKKEEVPELRDVPTNIEELVRSAGLERSAPYLYQGLGGSETPVPPDNVPHFYIPRDKHGNLEIDKAYPPIDVYEEAVKITQRNANLAAMFFKSHEAGIALAASLATLIGEPRAPVPGFVESRIWNEDAVASGKIFEELTEDERVLYEVLLYGKEQKDIDSATTARSPIGGMLFGSLGTKGMDDLSLYIQSVRNTAKNKGEGYRYTENPFSDPVVAKEYIEMVKDCIGITHLTQEFNDFEAARQYIRTVSNHAGIKTMETIITELHRVAEYYQDDPELGNPDRMTKLESEINKLGGKLKNYEIKEKELQLQR